MMKNWLVIVVMVPLSACTSAARPVAASAGGAGIVSNQQSTSAGTAPIEEATLIKEGYRREIHQGEVLFCRSETLTGSRFSSNVCQSKEQIEAREAAARRAMGAVRPDTTCALPKSSCN
jgi:putative hemolysin